MDLRSLINKLDSINEAEAPLPGAGQKGPTVAAAAGQDPTNPLNKASGQAAQPATSAEWKPTPEQEKWLGGADRQDPYILNRMPGQKPPVSYFKDPADQATAKQMGFPAAATSGQGAQPAKTATQEKINKLNQLLVQLAKTRSTAPAQGTTAPAADQQSGQAARPAAAPTTKSVSSKITQNPDGTFTYRNADGSSIKISEDGRPLIAEGLIESFGYTLQENAATDLATGDLGKTAATAAAGYGGGKVLSKIAGKAIPGVGTALSLKDAWDRWQSGDRTGAVIATLAGAGWLMPGPAGWIVGGGLDALNIGREIGGSADAARNKAASTQTASTGDPKIVALQKFLKKQGADLGTTGPNKDGIDGVLGGKTIKAMNAAGLSESQKEKLGDILSEAGFGAAWDVAKGLGKSFAGGMKNPELAKMVKNVKGVPGGATAAKIGGVVGRNPKKSAAASMGLGGYLGSKMDGDTTDPTATADASGATASAGGTTASTSNQAAQPGTYTPEQQQLMQQIKDTLTDLQMSAPNDPAVATAFSNAKQTIELFTAPK